MNPVKVSVPATSANLGPGFDSLGLALDLRTSVVLHEIPAGLEVTVRGEGAGFLPTNSTNTIVQAAYRVYEAVGKRPQGLRVTCDNRVPIGSGLGSSATAILAGTVGANDLLGNPLGSYQLVELAARVEGHPDNIVAAYNGGLTVSSSADDDLIYRRVEVPSMTVVVVMPQVELSTEQLRAALPGQVSMADAVANLSRTALVVEALRAGDLGLLARVMHDHLHIPYRKALIPGYDDALDAGFDAGAAAITLSGSGPSIIAFAESNHDEIAATMADAIAATGCDVRYWVLPVAQEGARIEGLG